MSDPDLQLSSQAQALLESHRLHRGPKVEQRERVWERVHQSAVALPLAGELATEAVRSAGEEAASAGLGKTAALGTAAAKGGALSASTTKIVLGIALTGGVAGVGVATMSDSQGEGEALEKVAPALRRASQEQLPSRPFARRARALQRKTQLLSPPPAPAPSPEAEALSVTKGPALSPPPSTLTRELAEKLRVLGEIDAQLRRGALGRAQQSIERYRSHYPSSEFAKDIEAMQLMIDCVSSEPAARSRVSRALQDRGYRRYWKRIRRACGAPAKK